MRLKEAAAISTALVLAVGTLMIFPFFIRGSRPERRVMLTFNVLDSIEAKEWCYNLSSVLEENDIKATVFIVGKVAEKNPECVSCFSQKVDIGSLTYDYLNLASISDYSSQLEEVRKGKQAVDDAGNLYSRLFRAPLGATDDNIYSLLGRCDILADFSYHTHYNLYQKNQFIRFDATVYHGSNHSASFFTTLPRKTEPTVILFDDMCSTSYISEFISELKKGDVHLVSASEIAERNLTLRGD